MQLTGLVVLILAVFFLIQAVVVVFQNRKGSEISAKFFVNQLWLPFGVFGWVLDGTFRRLYRKHQQGEEVPVTKGALVMLVLIVIYMAVLFVMSSQALIEFDIYKGGKYGMGAILLLFAIWLVYRSYK